MKNFFSNKKLIFAIVIAFFILCIIAFIFFYYQKNNEFLNDSNISLQESFSGNSNNSVLSECEDSKIYVHIVGEVKKNGIVELKEGARIADAIESAGGITEKADLSKVNLAFVISDGCKISIPSIEDLQEKNSIICNTSGDNTIVEDEGRGQGGKVNINTASQAELETLTGIGPSTAEKIIEYRKKNGKFKKLEDLKNVSGIGEQKYNGLKEEITIK